MSDDTPTGDAPTGDAPTGGADPGGLGLVPVRRLIDPGVDAVFRLGPGDRALVAVGESVVAGAPIAERVRDAQVVDVVVDPTASPAPMPGGRIADGELLFDWRGHWRVAAGALTEPVETPMAGIVREVRPGSAIVVRAAGQALGGIVALGGPTRGQVRSIAGKDGELRASSLDVGLAGMVLVVGARIDAETLTRARAMGIRGVVVGGLASKERRDFLASESRQRAALHRLPPFAVLVLEGAIRRPLASPVLALVEALEGREVAIVTDPPALVFDDPGVALPAPPAAYVRVRSGPLIGRDGTWAGALGPRRFPGGVHLEAGAVRLDDGRTVAVPLGDLERFA